MVNYINIKNLFGINKAIAESCDKNKNGKLEGNEITIFNKALKDYNAKCNNYKKQTSVYTAVQDAIHVDMPDIDESSLNKSYDLSKKFKVSPHQKVLSMINYEVTKRGAHKIDPELAEYWAQNVEKIAKEYDVPEVLLISIIGQESNGKFEKNKDSSNGAGPMQVTKPAINDFFPGAKGNWNDLYKKMNPKLLNDILNYKDKNGRPIKTPAELREACTKDNELGIKVGLLSFEMDYVKAAAAKKYKGPLYLNVPKAIKGLQDGSIEFTELENKAIIQTALENYNSVEDKKREYALNVIDSLAKSGIKFKDIKLVKKP